MVVVVVVLWDTPKSKTEASLGRKPHIGAWPRITTKLLHYESSSIRKHDRAPINASTPGCLADLLSITTAIMIAHLYSVQAATGR